ncbi:MAG: SDR family oxidoreductase [Anaerolineae bacterium]|nr:SDR family oxidoreductase [Anaerolineae bacterium]MBL8104924.1 SDR family oxidoreductase [Anaerolineales bacterium]MBV6395190.1 Gluconate 5-dehydrogenase [Anaerolineales bacterium]MCC7189426.1 SDR family oxidoreductase [Anaerolineales bacterium]
MESKLTGQTAIVTGGGRGFGREIARALAKEGVKIAVVARSADQLAETVSLIQNEGGQAIPVTADVTDVSAVAKMVAQVERELGAVDILVNNAGRLTSIAPVWEANPDEWWRDVEVNIRSVFLCCHAVLKGMTQRKRGRIINFTSSGMPNVSAYDCSKVAVTRFTDTLASEVKEFGISVFAMTVGPTHTEMMDYMIESEAGRKWLPDLSKWLEGKWQPAELAGTLAVTLASGKYDALTGRWVSPEDDLDDMLKRIEEVEKDGLYAWSIRGLKNQAG